MCVNVCMALLYTVADMKSVQVNVYLDEVTMRDVREIAKAQDRSVSWLIGFAVKSYVVAQGGHVTLLEPVKKAPKQLDISDAIAASVKRGPAKKAARHK